MLLNLIIYKTRDNETQIEVKFEKDTVWLTQSQMAELFGRNRVAITQHLGNIFREKELNKNSVCKDFLHTASDGKSYKEDGFKKIEDNTLVALTLMIAESKPAEKEMMITVILNLMQNEKYL